MRKKSHVISKFRFLEYGKKAPKNSRFKGVINTTTLIGWFSYTNRKEAANKKEDKGMHKNGLLGYTSRDGNATTYSSKGWLDSKDKINDFKKEISQAFHEKGNLCWDTVVSMKEYKDAFASGLYNVKDYAAIVEKILPDYFKSIGMEPSNMIWWMNYHDNKHNPHMHIVFMEKKQTITKGKLQKKYIDRYKTKFLKEFGMREKFKKEFHMDSKQAFKKIDEERNKIMDAAKNILSDSKIIDLTDLSRILPKEGRLSYNSKNMVPYKKGIDGLITTFLHVPEIHEELLQWEENVRLLDDFQNHLAGDKSSHLMENEYKKLYTRLGNLMIKTALEHRNSTLMQEEKGVLRFERADMGEDCYYLPIYGKFSELAVPKEYIKDAEDGKQLQLDDRKCVYLLYKNLDDLARHEGAISKSEITLKTYGENFKKMACGYIPDTAIRILDRDIDRAMLVKIKKGDILKDNGDTFVTKIEGTSMEIIVPKKEIYIHKDDYILDMEGKKFKCMNGEEIKGNFLFSCYDAENIKDARTTVAQVADNSTMTSYRYMVSDRRERVRSKGATYIKGAMLKIIAQENAEKERDLEKFIKMTEKEGGYEI